MKVTFYGVRGSIATPGAEFARYGGNTACVHVELNDGTDIILDSGTGIRLLGKKLAQKDTPIFVLLSHNHWDHIQGFPFFTPAYQPERQIHIIPGQTKEHQPTAVLDQMSGSYFPVPKEVLAADIVINEIEKNRNTWTIGNAKISRRPMNHPGGGSCYSIVEDGSKLSYITDNELYPPYKKDGDFLNFVDFAKDSDLMIHDAQYIVQDMPAKQGWGHSVAEEAVKLAMGANVKTLALYSHDPERTDKQVDAITEHADEILQIGGAVNARCIAAYEGLSISI
ncbi:MBL fold metallo-hydrolase [Agaribacter marinus]|uniref:MBL fold metallo-hydrolase n=1 Tax=Agaribacter marinus TaxID=1431249 RepID=A0AA37T122_9ALTE|nr:MBL fold metallo-hydrolase [Agaribacter marinus]GLR72997.1 MBL fold metallo-hydrolase [Agaribacter marinus]